eukprot:jgi/Bigna1/90889/estExt_fgenesh1_pg.C_820033
MLHTFLNKIKASDSKSSTLNYLIQPFSALFEKELEAFSAPQSILRSIITIEDPLFPKPNRFFLIAQIFDTVNHSHDLFVAVESFSHLLLTEFKTLVISSVSSNENQECAKHLGPYVDDIFKQVMVSIGDDETETVRTSATKALASMSCYVQDIMVNKPQFPLIREALKMTQM